MADIFSKNDKKFMNLALNLARKNIGLTSENPCVSCIIVKDNIILSTGITNKDGRPHAENIAINNCKEDIAGSTIYVTLEPCYHTGQTSPCVDLIISKKPAQVVIASQDPDKRVNGESIKKLKENNIEVKVGLFEEKAKEVNRGFFKSRTKNQPFVTLKLATSLDGKIAAKNNDTTWITNEVSRKFGHYLRSKNDAILVGANTVKIDNPTLDCRIDGLEDSSPIRIVLSNSLDLNLDSKVFQNQHKIKTYIATSSPNKDKVSQIKKSGIEVINFSDLKDFLNKLSEMGINNLLIEGGSKVSASFVKEELLDEIIHFQSNKKLGEDGLDAISAITIKDAVKNFKKTLSKNMDNDQMMVFQK